MGWCRACLPWDAWLELQQGSLIGCCSRLAGATTWSVHVMDSGDDAHHCAQHSVLQPDFLFLCSSSEAGLPQLITRQLAGA